MFLGLLARFTKNSVIEGEGISTGGILTTEERVDEVESHLRMGVRDRREGIGGRIRSKVQKWRIEHTFKLVSWILANDLAMIN